MRNALKLLVSTFSRAAITVTAFAMFCGTGCGQHTLPPPEKVELAPPAIVEMELVKGLPIVSAHLNGRGPFRFILDTGAQGTVVSENVARELNLPSLGQANMGRPGTDKAVAATVTRIETIEVGGVKIDGVSAVFADLSSITQRVPSIQGVLSTALFRGLLVTFDYPQKKIGFRRGELSQEDNETIFAWSVSETAPRVTVDVAGEKVRMQLDTGSTNGFTVSSVTAGKLSWIDLPKEGVAARTVDKENKSFSGRMKGVVRVGKFPFKDPRISYDDLTLSIGYDVLKDFAVILDQKTRRLELKQAVESTTGSEDIEGSSHRIDDGDRKH